MTNLLKRGIDLRTNEKLSKDPDRINLTYRVSGNVSTAFSVGGVANSEVALDV